MNKAISQEEACVRYCRRSIQLALIFIVIASVIAVVQLTVPGAGIFIKNVMSVLPVFLIISIIWLVSLKNKAGISKNSAAFKVVMEDELRMQSLNRAFRSSFLLVIILQIPMGYFLNINSFIGVSIIQSFLTIVLGIISFLSLFLIYDR